MTPSTLTEIPSWEWPPAAREIIKDTLRDRDADPSERIAAAQLGGDIVVMDDEMADLLLAALSDSGESEELRARAAIALGPALEEADIDGYESDLTPPAISEEKFNQVRDTLRALYADDGLPKEVRRRILEASVRSPIDWHRDAVLDAAASEDEDWKLTAAFAMRYIPGFEDEILEMLESLNPEIYYEAIQAAGVQEVEGAWPHIATLLTAPGIHKDLLLAAIEAAPLVNREEAKLLLVDLYDHEDEDISEAASEAMQMAEMSGDPDDDLEDDEFGGEVDDDLDDEESPAPGDNHRPPQ